MWIGLLFTIMCLAGQFQKFRLNPDIDSFNALFPEPGLQSMIEAFRERTVQCLVMGKYTNGGPYVLETLLLYFASEHFFSKDADMGLWILLGVIVQFAMRMGHHRDPKHFKGISPLAAEMRRRIWATVVQMDLGVSTQMGLPRLIKQWQADTEEPRNLLDSDFDENTTELPPSRPETELTVMLCWIVKTRMASILGLITDFAADTRPYSYAEVMKMDTRLHDAHASIPPCLKWRSIAHCVTDSPDIIVQKMYMEVLYNKARIILHRKYFFLHSGTTTTQTTQTNPSQNAYSCEACLDAAVNILKHQHTLDEEVQPLGQLYQDRWRVSSIISHDFLLATSILCFYLQSNRGQTRDGSDSETVENIENILRRSYGIWVRTSASSREAQKAARALRVVLGNLDADNASSNRPSASEAVPPLPGSGGSVDYLQGEIFFFPL